MTANQQEKKDPHEGYTRQFSVETQAWYAMHSFPANQIADGEHEILVTLTHPQATGEGDFVLRWHNLRGAMFMRLEMFQPNWHLMRHFQDVFERMAALPESDVALNDVIDMLKSCGIEDVTRRLKP